MIGTPSAMLLYTGLALVKALFYVPVSTGRMAYNRSSTIFTTSDVSPGIPQAAVSNGINLTGPSLDQADYPRSSGPLTRRKLRIAPQARFHYKVDAR
jgi:hypothetical protein